jgi:hypothetical protein
VESHWAEIEAVATALLEHKELDGDVIKELLEALTGETIPASKLFSYASLRKRWLTPNIVSASEQPENCHASKKQRGAYSAGTAGMPAYRCQDSQRSDCAFAY